MASVLYPFKTPVSGFIVTVFIALTIFADWSISSINIVIGNFKGIVTLKPLYPWVLRYFTVSTNSSGGVSIISYDA